MKMRAGKIGAALAAGVLLGSTMAHADCAPLIGAAALSAQVSNGTSIACFIGVAPNGSIDGACQVYAKGKAPANKEISGNLKSKSCVLSGNFTVAGPGGVPKVTVKSGVLVDANDTVTIGGGVGMTAQNAHVVNFQVILGAI